MSATLTSSRFDDGDYCAYIKDYCGQRGITISALAYYPNPLDPQKGPGRGGAPEEGNPYERRPGREHGHHLYRPGPGPHGDENIELAKQAWPPILKLAEELGVRIAIENCPMLFGPDQWPGGQNVFTTPTNWEKIFAALPSPNLVSTTTPAILSGR